MRAAASRSRNRGPLRFVRVAGAALVLVGFGTVASLWALGVVEVPFFKKHAARPSVQPSGIPVPLSARPIPAYTLLTREHFINPQTGQLELQYFPAAAAKEYGFITDLSQMIGRGRVLRRDKAPGYAFTERDFFPEHTRPGLVAGVPPDKRAFVLHADNITGIHGLQIGDHFDMVATLPVDVDKTLPKSQMGDLQNALALERMSGAHLPKRASSKVLVQNGVIILPVAVREIPLSSPSSNNPNDKGKTKPVQEATIAVDPNEVTLLSEAMAVHAEFICVARSGRPEDRGTSMTRSSYASPNLHIVETIAGGKRRLLAFPKAGGGPEPVMEGEPGEEPPRQETAAPAK